MISFLKKFKKSTPPKLEMQTYTMKKNAEVSFGVPHTLMPEDFLRNLSEIFATVDIINRAGYILMYHNKELSYVMALDLNVDESHQREALNHILQLLKQELKVPYNGIWPLDFHTWNHSLVEFFAEQSPDLMFYIRKN